MAKDEFKNLGFADPADKSEVRPRQEPPEKGVKGELRW